jgi:hypothetical protein
MMQPMFEALLKLMKEPVRHDRGVKTDNSILLIYPPEKELDFREQLLDSFVPALQQQGVPFELLDLTGFIFSGLDENEIESLQEDEFDDYRWMLQGLSRRVEASLYAHLSEIANKSPGGNVFVYATVALHPLVKLGEVLRGLRDLHCRIALAFPGEERGGKLHFMNQPDGGNYLAVKLFWR